MNLNVWNIKDMFSVPPGAGAFKSSSRNATSSDHSSLTDSQFLFSSQFFPDNSQPGYIDYKSQSNYVKNSNPNSQESGREAHSTSSQPSDPGMYQKYQSKPPLFCTDSKERGPFGKANGKNIIEQFEESKRKAKDKYENEQLNQLICQVHSIVQELKVNLGHVEENTNLQCKSVVDSMDATSKALQENITSFHESMQKIVSSKCSCRQVFLDLENKIISKNADLTDLKSNVQLLVAHMDAMKSQQYEKHLELSEKLTWLSNSIKSSEDKILNFIHNLNYVSKPVHHLKENTTQTSPTSFQNLPAEEHLRSQFKTTMTCLDGSTFSQNTCDRISNGFSSQNTKNLCLAGLKNVSTEIAGSVGSSGSFSSQSSGGYVGSKTGGHRTHFRKGFTMGDGAVKSLCSLQHVCCNDNHVSVAEDHHLQHTKQHNGKENKLSACRSKEKSQSLRKANSHRKKSKNKKSFPIKNNTQVISRAEAGKSQDKSENEPVTHQLGNSVRQMENCFTLYSEGCESSLPVTPGLVRKVQKKNVLKCAPLCIRHTSKHHAKNETGECKTSSLKKNEDYLEDYNLPIWDSNPLYYNTEQENDIIWLPPSSPSLNNTSINPISHKKQKDLISMFFDSSDDSN